jgi:hypothetical protein
MYLVGRFYYKCYTLHGGFMFSIFFFWTIRNFVATFKRNKSHMHMKVYAFIFSTTMAQINSVNDKV